MNWNISNQMTTHNNRIWIFFISILLLALAPSMMCAQKKKPIHLESEITLWNLRKATNATFAQLGREPLRDFGSDYCRTLYLKKVKDSQLKKILAAITKDRELARVVREIIDGGILVSGYYIFSTSPATPRTKMYLIYSRNIEENSLYLIVLCGANDTEELAEQLRINAR
ncbi:MAG: hypothetical protein Q4A76_06220 [Porphyromonadaceae bacterium]|nr:hypothetical protein [Porphyromonadaceae bacterium]